MEQNFNRVREADNLLPPVIIRVLPSVKESKSDATSPCHVSDCDSVIFSFNLKVSETDPDGVALRNLDFLDLVDVVGVILGEVERGDDTSCWKLFFR